MSTKTESREALERELHRYLDDHRAVRGEAYKFDIRIRAIPLPAAVRALLTPRDIENIVGVEMSERVADFALGLKDKFPWIGEWTQAGRMGGWLVIETESPVLDEYGNIEDVSEARQRLNDLDEISEMVRSGIGALVDDLESHRFWAQFIPNYSPRAYGRKHWDPREA